MKPVGQTPVFLACAVAAGLASFAFDPATSARFSSYGAGLPPATVLAVCIVLGSAALWVLERARFLGAKRRKLRLGPLFALTLAFAVVAIAIDITHPFPEAINARFPQSLLFYPAIAVVAETAFHLVPAALVFSVTRRASFTIVVVALTEPVFQLAAGWQGTADWTDLAIGLNIFAISLTQLILFRRYGFLAMLGFRLGYYLWWHVLWGEARLVLLF